MQNIKINIDLDEIDNHYTEKLNENLEKIREQYLSTKENMNPHNNYIFEKDADSPLTMSVNSENENMSECVINTDDLNVMDIINSYFRCQKNIYEQCAIISNRNNNIIFLTTITITTSSCVFILFLETYQLKISIIILNIIITMLLLISKYCKLERNAELYLCISKQFGMMLDNVKNTQIDNQLYSHIQCDNSKIKERETRYNEILDIHNIRIIPRIQILYPVSSNINIFSFIKKIDSKKIITKNKLNNTKSEIRYILNKYSNSMGSRENNRLTFLIELKDTLKKEMNNITNSYSYMDEIFTREAIIANQNKYFYNWFASKIHFYIDHSHCNPIVDEYITFILSNQ
uniref:Uncharacterized protein n=1 Tax=viral metagenome TaxID=1070528 RepID=A0A6C0JZF6_9ZZZZ